MVRRVRIACLRFFDFARYTLDKVSLRDLRSLRSLLYTKFQIYFLTEKAKGRGKNPTPFASLTNLMLEFLLDLEVEVTLNRVRCEGIVPLEECAALNR